MPNPLPAVETLNREFLPIRARLLEIAAALDRIDRGEGDVAQDPRMEWILAGIELLQSRQNDRAEQIQLLFSQPYDEGWKQEFAIQERTS